MTVPTWLQDVIDRCESLSLDNDADRETLVVTLLTSLPTVNIATAIAEGAHTVLAARGIRDGRGDMATAIAKVAANRVLQALRGAP